MPQHQPKNRSPWPRLTVGTRVVRVWDNAPGTIITVRRTKFARRYEIVLDAGIFIRERRPDIRAI